MRCSALSRYTRGQHPTGRDGTVSVLMNVETLLTCLVSCDVLGGILAFRDRPYP